MIGSKVDAGPLRPRLEVARDAVAAWRRGRPRSVGMPEAHWAEAVALARLLGVYYVARFLPVDFGALKKRLGESDAAASTRADSAACFVEFGGSQLLESSGVRPSMLAPAGTVVELAGYPRRIGVRLGSRRAGAKTIRRIARIGRSKR